MKYWISWRTQKISDLPCPPGVYHLWSEAMPFYSRIWWNVFIKEEAINDILWILKLFEWFWVTLFVVKEKFIVHGYSINIDHQEIQLKYSCFLIRQFLSHNLTTFFNSGLFLSVYFSNILSALIEIVLAMGQL